MTLYPELPSQIIRMIQPLYLYIFCMRHSPSLCQSPAGSLLSFVNLCLIPWQRTEDPGHEIIKF